MAQKERGWARRLVPLLAPLLVAAVLLAYGIRYDTNDDATLANIAAGAYGPDRIHLVYVNILFGLLLRPLYLLAPGANWYVIVQLGLLAAAGAAGAWLLAARLGALRGGAVFLAAALPFAVAVVYDFHYVKVSGVCLAAGLGWLAARLGQPLKRCWPGLLLALAGSLLRWDMFPAVGGLSAAVLLARFLALDKAGRRRALGAMAVLFALVLGARGADVLAYRLDGGWRAYTAYNAARMEFSDYKVYFLGEENPFAAQGLSDNDYAMLRAWDFYDGSVFPAQRLRALAAQVPGKGPLRGAWDALRTAWHLTHGAPFNLLFTAVALGGLVPALRRRRPWAFLGTGALLAAELFYLAMRARTPEYVTTPLLLAAVCFLGMAAGPPQPAPAPRCRPYAAALALGAALAVSAPTLYATFADAAAYRTWAAQERQYFADMAADGEHLYLLSAEALTVGEGLDVWHPWAPGHYDNIVYYGGWLSHAPHREAALAAYGLADPLTGAVDSPNVYLDYHGIERAAQYAAEHLGRPVQAVRTGPNDFCPFQLVSAG